MKRFIITQIIVLQVISLALNGMVYYVGKIHWFVNITSKLYHIPFVFFDGRGIWFKIGCLWPYRVLTGWTFLAILDSDCLMLLGQLNSQENFRWRNNNNIFIATQTEVCITLILLPPRMMKWSLPYVTYEML